MQQENGCAASGILFDNFSEMSDHVEYARELFTIGNLAPPPSLNIGDASNSEIRDFVIIMLGLSFTLMSCTALAAGATRGNVLAEPISLVADLRGALTMRPLFCWCCRTG